MPSRLVHRADAIGNLSAKGSLCIVPGTRIYRGSVSCQEYDRFRIPARHRPQSPAMVAASHRGVPDAVETLLAKYAARFSSCFSSHPSEAVLRAIAVKQTWCFDTRSP